MVCLVNYTVGSSPMSALLPPETLPSYVHVDIGTQNKIIHLPGDNTLILTFDPFEKMHYSDPHENIRYLRLPYAIAPEDDDNRTFYFNHAIPGCSSLLRSNPYFEQNRSAVNDFYNCAKPSAARKLIVTACRAPPRVTTRTLRAVALGAFLKARGVRRVGTLKIDAQVRGSAIGTGFGCGREPCLY